MNLKNVFGINSLLHCHEILQIFTRMPSYLAEKKKGKINYVSIHSTYEGIFPYKIVSIMFIACHY